MFAPALAPLDEHNRALLDTVRPQDWKNPSHTGRYGLLVIGAGSAGLAAARHAARRGARVALVERRSLGGRRLLTGEIPTTALLRSARLAAALRRSSQLGIRIPPGAARIDFSRVMERVRRVRRELAAQASPRALRDELGVDVYFGEARFIDASRAQVGGETLRFRRALIATGTRTRWPAIESLGTEGSLHAESVFNLNELPRRLLVVGGGRSGCQLAQGFAQLGAQVWLVEREPRLLSRLGADADAAALLARALCEDGVDVRLGTALSRVSPRGDDRVCTLGGAGALEELRVDAVLLATGRQPETSGLGLEALGLEVAGEGVSVDAWLRTEHPRIHAAGSVCRRAAGAMPAEQAGHRAAANALGRGRGRRFDASTRWSTLTEPEVAQLGLTPQAAAHSGIVLENAVRELRDVERARSEGEEGFVKLYIGRGRRGRRLSRFGRRRLRGASIVAPRTDPFLGELSQAIAEGKGPDALAERSRSSFSRAEALGRLGQILGAQGRSKRYGHGHEERWLRRAYEALVSRFV